MRVLTSYKDYVKIHEIVPASHSRELISTQKEAGPMTTTKASIVDSRGRPKLSLQTKNELVHVITKIQQFNLQKEKKMSDQGRDEGRSDAGEDVTNEELDMQIAVAPRWRTLPQ